MLTVNLAGKSRTPLEQLIDVAQSNKLYDQDVLNTLGTNDEKIKYLEILASANSLALSNRISADGYDYSAIEDKRLKFQALETEYELAIQASLASNAEYQTAQTNAYNKQLNEQFAKDERITGNNAVKTIVDTKYSGDYSKFMSEYKDTETFFADEYLSFADMYDEAETAEVLKYMQESASTIESSQDINAQLLARKTRILEAIAVDAKARIERIAWENASWAEKTSQSMKQIILAPITELGNVLEGVIDVAAAGAMAIAGLFGGGEEIKDFIAKDTIPLDTLLAEALPYSYITSPYAKDNPLKWLYEIETSIIDMAPMALNLVAPGVGTFIYYASSAGRTTEGYINEFQDAGIGEIIAYTTMSTTVEFLTEKLNTDVVFGKGLTEKWTKMCTGNKVLEITKAMIGEGVEEVISETGSQIAASLLRGKSQMNFGQIVRAGALGAAVGGIMQTASYPIMTKRLLGINTTLTNAASGMSINLSARESATVEQFLETCKTKLDKGKTLSERDAAMYERFKGYDRTFWMDGKKIIGRFAKIESGSSNYTYSGVMPTENAQSDWMNTKRYDNELDWQLPTMTEVNGADMTQYTTRTSTAYTLEQRDGHNIISQRSTPDITTSTTTADVTGLYSSLEMLVETVNNGADEKTITEAVEKIIPQENIEEIRTELQQMSTVWFNSLVADENSQDVLQAVNDYYNRSLENIIERLDFTPAHGGNVEKQAKNLGLALNANITITTEKSGATVYNQLRTAFGRAYPDYNLVSFVSDNANTPVVTVIGKDVYVDHRYIRDTNITSIVKQIETQILCDTFYSELNADAQQMLTDIQNKAYNTPLFNVYRRNQLNKQILYSALFVPNNPMAISLSELDHTAYENLRDILLEQAKVKNVAIKNAAYRGLKVYDLTILNRMSADEAVSKNLLSGNYSIEDLLNERGPDSERYTFKYGMDASQAGVRVLSAIRHLADNFGFETNIDNLYTVLGDILDPNKYSKFDEFQKVLNMYSNWNEFMGEVEAVPSRTAINLYLRDQFDFEIDGRGNIIATKDVEALVDIDKALAALDEGKPIAVQNILTQEGIQVFSPSECIMVFVDEIEGAQGNKQSNTVGKSLITISKKPGKRDFIDVIFHELQHHLTTHAHQPFGAAQVLKAGVLQSVYKTTTDKAQFLRDMLTAIEDHASKEETRNKCTELLALPDDKLIECAAPNDTVDDEYLDWANTMVYQYYDMDEQQSNFNIVKVGADAPGAYFSTTGAGPAVLRVNAQNLRGSAAVFLNRFEGLSIIMRATDVDAKLNQITAGTETFDSLIMAANFAEIEESSDARTESNGLYDKLLDTLETHGTRPTTKQLCQPTYWAQHCTNKELKARVVTYTPADCKQLVQRLTGYVFDDYQGEFVQPENVFKPADYIKYTSSTGFVQARENTTVIQLPRDYKPGKDTKLDRALSELSEEQKNTAAYYVDDRLFANINAAIDFTNSDKVFTSTNTSNKILATFDQFIDALPQTGFEFSQDFVLITHDGKVVGYNSDGKPGEVFKAFATKLNLSWQQLCEGLKVDIDTGNYIGNLESGKMKQLLNAKKIVRAYRVGDSWEAYGKPNYIQDLYLRQMNTTSKQVSYLTPADPIYTQYLPGTARLVVNEKGAVTVDRGQYAGYPEVSWKNNTWYRAMIQIIEKYDIRKLSELKQLGFNDSFIESMKRNYGRTIQTGTAAKLGLSQQFVDATRKYTGVAQDVITQFINDESAHPFARNLLIQNAQARTSTDNLNWAMCSHIRTVEDVDNYLRAMLSYFGTLSRKKNYTKYSSLDALMAAANNEYRASDSTIAGINDATFADAGYDTLTTLFLNTDARQRGKANRVVTKDENGNIISEEYVDRLFNAEGLDYSLKGFEAALGAIRRGYASEKTSEHGRGNVRSSDIDVKAKGGHADEGGTISLADTSAKAIAQSLLNGAEAKLETQENVPYLNAFKRGITEALKYGDNTEKALSVLNKLEKYLVAENAKVVDNEEGAWDSYLKQLHTYTKKLQKVLGESGKTRAATSSVGVSDLITAAKERIDKSDDKLKQHDTEYQLLTNNRARLVTQYSETGYKQLLEAVKAMKPKDASGKSVGMSNITDNISKRLGDGKNSIQHQIDKFPDGHPKTLELLDTLRSFRKMNFAFRGVKSETAGLTTMRKQYSELLSTFHKGLVKMNVDELREAVSSYNSVKRYLDNLILTGEYDYRMLVEKDMRDTVIFNMTAIEQLISGNITLPQLAMFKDAPFETRIETARAVYEECEKKHYHEYIMDRLRKLLNDASIIEIEESSDARPKIDLSILKLAQSRADLSEDAAERLTKTVDKLNQEWKDARGDAARKAEMSNAVKAAQEATNKATYMTRSVDRLTRQYRKYLNSPAITQEEAEALIKHAATMIEVHDYQTTSHAFQKRANKAWSEFDDYEARPDIREAKGIFWYIKKGSWPKYFNGTGVKTDTTEDLKLAYKQAKATKDDFIQKIIADFTQKAPERRAEYIRARQAAREAAAKLTSEESESAIQEKQEKREYIQSFIAEQLSKTKYEAFDGTIYYGKEALNQEALEKYEEQTERIKEQYKLSISDPVELRRTAANLDLAQALQRGDLSVPSYHAELAKRKKTQNFVTAEQYAKDAVSDKLQDWQIAATAKWEVLYEALTVLESKDQQRKRAEVDTPTSTNLHKVGSTINSVNDLLNMYNERTTETTPRLEDIPLYQDEYTTHLSFEEKYEQAAKGLKIHGTNEDNVFNGIVNGVQKAITEFQYRPMTLASAIKFINDIRSILRDGKLNESLFSWKDNVPLERITHNAFDEFERIQLVLATETESGSIAVKPTDKSVRVAKGTTLTAVDNMMKYLKSGKFTSHAQEIEQQFGKAVDEISGAVNTLLETEYTENVTEEDKKPESELSSRMRHKEDNRIDKLALAALEAEFDDLDAQAQAAFEAEFDEIEESSDLLDDVDWDFDDLEYEDEQPTESTKSTPKPESKQEQKSEQPKTEKKSKKEDTRPIEEQFKPEDEASRSSYKTTRSELLTRNGVDIAKALEYQFKETVSMDIYGTDVERQRVSTQEFITNPEVSQVIRQLLNNEAAIKDFLTWLSEARAIDEVTSLKALIILNKIEASPTLSFELRKEAQAIRKYKKSIAGAVLGLGNRHGLVPAEELSMLATDMLKLTDDERTQLKTITDAQKVAIDNGDYTAADEAMKELFKILQKHQHELDISINPFGKMEHSEELQKAKAKLETVQTEEERKAVQEEIDRLRTVVDEERAVRWHNLTDKITTWRFFAMLSAPSTFFAKNVAGNYVAKGMNRASEVFASGFEKLINKKRGFKYTNVVHKASDAAKRATDTQLVQSGILNGIMSNTVARYETGYVYRPSTVRNLSIDLSKSEELEPSKAATLRGILRAETPFGKMNEKGETNFAAAALNKMYGIIFGTMNKWDKKFMQADIQRLTEQLCTNNFTPDELEMLANKTADEALLTKFYEIVEFARQEACKTYFRSQPKFYNDLMAMLNKHPVAQAVVSTIMPFPRMVVNATMTALVYSPFGYIKGLMTLQADKSMFANIRASQEFGKATVGSIAMVAAALLAALGVLDIDEEDPYIGPQLTIGDLRVSLEGLEPSATPFITGAMLVLGSKYDNTGAFTSAANALLNTTVLGEMLSAFGNDDTPSAWIGSLFASYVTQFIPTILRRFTQLIDPSKKTYSGKGKAFKRIVAAIPFASYAIEDKIDPYSGDTIMQHTDAGNIWLSRFLVLFNAVSPTKISWDTDSSVEKESKDVGAPTTGPSKVITKDGVKYEIPKKLYNEYKVLRAQLYSQYANELIKTDAYKKLSNEKKAKKLKALQESATKEARKQLNIDDELNIP